MALLFAPLPTEHRASAHPSDSFAAVAPKRVHAPVAEQSAPFVQSRLLLQRVIHEAPAHL